jgi:SAM-dependent methyltransferase
MKLSEALNSVHLSLKRRLSIISKLGYLLPFSPFRGIVYLMPDKRSSNILDVGCGTGAFPSMLKLRGTEIPFAVGVDLYLPYLRQCKDKGLYDDVVLCDARCIPFREGSFDVLLAIDVIEHLPKEDGLNFLRQLEKLAVRQVILTTPVGFVEVRVPSCVHLKPLEDKLLKHRSGWLPHEFRIRGYKVRGMIGPSFIPKDIAYWLSFILPLTYFAPAASYSMICTRRNR